LPVDESELIHIVKVKAGVSEDALSHVVELMLVMEVFDGLLEAYGDKEADDDRGNVDEEFAPGAGGVVGRDGHRASELAPSDSPSSPEAGLELAAALHAQAQEETALPDWAGCLT
jgi:hypothetical protein